MNTPTTYNNVFCAIPADKTWRPLVTHRPLMDGPQIAIVTGLEGEEIHCDEYGRVKARFPWDRYSKNDEHSSAWLRVSQGWAGGQYGFMALPRIGNEVIVSFLDGGPDQPIITGRTYHATNTPPYALPEHKTRTTLKTQTHKGEGSNKLRFEDEADKEQVYIHAQKDLDLLTENNRTEVIKNDSHQTVENDQFSHIKANSHNTVDGETRQTIGADCSQNIGGTLHQKSSSAILCEAGSEVHHRVGAQVVLDAGAEITISGGGSFIKLVLDGIAIDNLPVKVYQWGQDKLEADWLYTGTPWEPVKSKSPWLVYLDHPNNPALSRFLEEQAVRETGYLLVGADGQDRSTLAAAMRRLLQVERIDGVPELLRIGHPDIAWRVIGQRLLQGAYGPDWPFSALIAPDGVEEQWVYHERKSAGLMAQSAGKSALAVDDKLLQGFRQFNQRQSVIAYLEVAGEGSKAWLGSGTRPDHVQRLTITFDQADQWGFNTPRSRALFLGKSALLLQNQPGHTHQTTKRQRPVRVPLSRTQ